MRRSRESVANHATRRETIVAAKNQSSEVVTQEQLESALADHFFCVRKEYTDTRQVYSYGSVDLIVECVDKVADKWVSTYEFPATKNASGTPIAAKSYRLEAPAALKSARDHASISIGRGAMSRADDIASTDAAKKADVKMLTAQNESLLATNRALAFALLDGPAISDSDYKLIDESVRKLVDDKRAKIAQSA